MNYFKRLEAARKEFGVAFSRPQDDYKEFLRYLRALNNSIGTWKDWPEATAAVKERIQESKFMIHDYVSPNWIPLEFVPFEIADDRDVFLEMMKDLRKQEVISLDFEFHKEHSYNGFIALIQASTMEFNYIIDPFNVRNELLQYFVPEVFENMKLLKIMCGCSNDALMTQSNFQSFLTSVIDVQDLYDQWKFEDPDNCFGLMRRSFLCHMRELRQQKRKDLLISDDQIRDEWSKDESVSYKKLIQALFANESVIIDKTAQLADFRVRPLGKLAKYAAYDVHYLLEAFGKLYGKVTWEDKVRAFEKTKWKLKKTVSIQKYPTYIALLAKKVTITKPEDVELFKTLHAWRDEIAKTMDENPEVIMTAKELETLAKLSSSSVTLDSLGVILKGNTCRFTTMQYRRLVAIINRDEVVLNSVVTMECHNCHGKGHQGWQCPHPIDITKCRVWMQREENWRSKMKQAKRRAINWFNKTGRWPKAAPSYWLEQYLENDGIVG